MAGMHFPNGTIERACKITQEVFRLLLSDLKISQDHWPDALPLVQLVLNHSPRPSLGGLSPVQVCAHTEPESPLSEIVPAYLPPLGAPVSPDVIIARHAALMTVFRDMHKAVDQRRRDKRSKSRSQVSQTLPNFMEGDFVLWGRREDSTCERNNKIAVRWLGPYRIVRVNSEWHYTLENLVTGDHVDAHVTRIKFYHDPSLEVTQDLLQYVSSGIGFVVDSFIKCRFHGDRWELQVRWSGFEESDVSWEPASNMVEDVPVLVKQFIKAHSHDVLVQEMASAIFG
uniref:Chromo domain-containing protein n=1 Tax=Spongospora subterranea TaxID=70186 RepID=A0A0H5RIS6_9EUKA|eukprot:CRZ08599.1 hypothetical protein [Spongospora subterranea]